MLFQETSFRVAQAIVSICGTRKNTQILFVGGEKSIGEGGGQFEMKSCYIILVDFVFCGATVE